MNAWFALLLGAAIIGFAPICVRFADSAGPAAIGAWRLLLALPVVIPMAWLRRRSDAEPALPVPGRGDARWWAVGAGLCFAGDLVTWHWSIRLTGVAHATLFSNCAPLVMALGLWLILGQRPGWRLALGLAVAMAGVGFLVGDPGVPGRAPEIGAVAGLASAFFYAGYQWCISRASLDLGAVRAMGWSSAVGCAVLAVLALASGETLVPATVTGWIALLVLGLVVHVAGQGLIALALARLPSGPASIGLLLQPVVAALAAWPLCGERPGGWQVVGAILILAGVVLARWAMQRPGPAAAAVGKGSGVDSVSQ